MIETRLKYYKLSNGEKEKILDSLRRELEEFNDTVFAYIHGGFVEKSFQEYRCSYMD
ncbi:hypothetical protein [Staphylothermus hellenicus]|uniref:Uncharacterized protein n=1 Tax=Staphylothermus hellenicus (strain DSM 12710 / JCM 10830 / BK20S6-10-b1 / P8) TaxID=591019 RepID=D7D890_STAHD|nr:hypothetical protein [Staphylothermus hellenicus]ADI31986.1 hypothetical protein Shell_0876 [Staphylothermus hellenicus DSM 12710]